MLDVAGLPRSTYYYYTKKQKEPDKHAELKEEICAIVTENKGRYGYRRVTQELRNRGLHHNHKLVMKLMRQMGLSSKVRMKKYRSYKGEVGKIAPNLLERDFYAEKPNQKWVTDVTEFSLFGEKIYLSPILDLCSENLVSYTISDRPVLSMVTSMLDAAFATIPDDTGLILHSDQGWQLLQDDQAQLEQLVNTFFHQTLLKDRVTNLALVKYHLIELVTCALQAAHKCYVPTCDLAQIRSDVYSELQSCGTLQSLEDLVSGMLRDLCTRVQHIDTGGYSPKVQFAVRYVHRHYNDSNLSLKTLADKLAVNSAYLGRQFSLETGVFFSDYLNEVRIQHAKQLLNTTPLKLAEVAERVGFVNVSYFSTIYKKLTGERPGQSRKYGKA